jgi:hypothetical protein
VNDWGNLPSQKEVSRFANTGLITIFAMLVAAGVPIGLSKLMPGLPFAALIVIFGVLMIPVLVGYGLAIRHMVRSVRLRSSEQREGRIVYTNRLGGLMGQHPYAAASVVIGGSLLIALIWTLLANK